MAREFVTKGPPFGVDTVLAAALDEDLGVAGDITSALLLDGPGPAARGSILARAAGRLSGMGPAQRVFALVDAGTVTRALRTDGASVAPGDELLVAEGSAAVLLAAERTALNVLSRLSGIATLTARFVEAVRGTRAVIVDTRKTTPGWRAPEKEAVRHGGGTNHRMGLHDEVLLKENHFALAGGSDRATLVARVKHRAPPGVRVIAEARDLQEAAAAADGGADVILLDNFGVQALHEAVETLGVHPRRDEFLLEASGGVSLETVHSVARMGVDRISVGALTHSAPALDLSMLIGKAGP